MLKRVIVAVVGIPLLLVTLFQPGGGPFAALAAILGAVAVLELSAAKASHGEPVTVAWPLLTVGILVAACALPHGERFRMGGLTALVLVAFTVEAWRGQPHPFRRLADAAFIGAYAGLFAAPVALRMNTLLVTMPSGAQVEAGALGTLTALLLVWATDTGAFFVGRTWGRRKLAPRLSPNKTWEGAMGGWLAAALIGWMLGHWGGDRILPGGEASGLALGLLAGAWAQVGDLSESALKRDLGVKDFGGWLPGHGGVLDRFDSFLFVCPLVHLWMTVGGIQGLAAFASR